MSSADRRILVVVNPISGNGLAERLLAELKNPGKALWELAHTRVAGDPSSWPVVRTTPREDATWRIEVEAFVRSRGVRTVLVIGGDGTFAEAAALLYGLRDVGDLAIIPIPGGRGNDFARTHYGYSAEMGDFWRWADGRVRAGAIWVPRALDLASADGRLFLNMASIGYGGRVVENAHARKAFWSKTSLVYQVEGLIGLAGSGDGRVNVKVDGESLHTGPFFGAFVGNGKCNGRGLYWTRQARPDDGLLDAIVFPKPGMLEMARTMAAIKSTSEPAPDIAMAHKVFRGSEITLHFDRPTALEIDGEFVGDAISHGFVCLPKALTAWGFSEK